MAILAQKDIFDLYDLMVEQLRDLYDGELQQITFLESQSNVAVSFELIEFLSFHLKETKRQARRILEIFEILNEDAEGESCDGIKGLIKESKKLADRCINKEVRDAAVITAIQHINHYEMAGYGTAIAYAKTLHRHDIAELLLDTLREEKRADMGLSDLAENQINPDAKWSAIIKKIQTPSTPEA
ncbi:ferritin-like domain-containing protein [Fodinibius sp. Rm-B-1B1-1]|uniref:YciE/YciF ferroxidase family protein n=1 Tax=Fodinibius alkaliphilus TaxID=3140241 RepID=UPI00315A5CF9